MGAGVVLGGDDLAAGGAEDAPLGPGVREVVSEEGLCRTEIFRREAEPVLVPVPRLALHRFREGADQDLRGDLALAQGRASLLRFLEGQEAAKVQLRLELDRRIRRRL